MPDPQKRPTPSTPHPVLGIVGCGNIGSRQTANFLAHGYTVYIYDIESERLTALQQLGAHVAHSCAELAAQAEVVFTALPTPEDVTAAVLDGDDNLRQGLRAGSVYIDISTNAPETVLRLQQALQAVGIEMLDAPFNDCPKGAYSREGMGLAVLASGPRSTFERVHPLLQLIADHVLYCGEIGQGTRCKLIHNAVNAVAVQAVSEGITLGLAQSIPLATLWDTLRFGSFGQNAGDIHGLPYYWFSRRCDDPTQQPAFTIKLLHKDLRLALAMAHQHNVPVIHMSLTAADYAEAERRGWSHCAATKVRCLQEERASVRAEAVLPVSPETDESKPEDICSVPIHATTGEIKFSLYQALGFILLSNLMQFILHRLL